ncbi:hypothetical protein BC830DRAFT_476790 [Chytriomyces sp. MP71]|nr:hypothetical protein BC830DRAFT_476790 [Chytriomyces sp. MP71]
MHITGSHCVTVLHSSFRCPQHGMAHHYPGASFHQQPQNLTSGLLDPCLPCVEGSKEWCCFSGISLAGDHPAMVPNHVTEPIGRARSFSHGGDGLPARRLLAQQVADAQRTANIRHRLSSFPSPVAFDPHEGYPSSLELPRTPWSAPNSAAPSRRTSEEVDRSSLSLPFLSASPSPRRISDEVDRSSLHFLFPQRGYSEEPKSLPQVRQEAPVMTPHLAAVLTQAQISHSRSKKRRDTFPEAGYVCRLCNIAGHWMENCLLFRPNQKEGTRGYPHY